MAENKKKVIVYTDWIEQFKDLTDEEAGRLIKHFFEYVNDLNPISDRLTELLFNPIKATLKRDLIKYKESIEDKSNAGKLGNLKRWNKDLYEDVIVNKLDLNKALDIAERRKLSHSDSVLSQGIAKIAVNDSVSVSVSVNDNVINNNIVESIDYDGLLDFINSTFKRNFKIINKDVRKKYITLFKKGYTKEDLFDSIINVANNNYHIESNYQYCTPEFFSRTTTLDKYSNVTIKEPIIEDKYVKHVLEQQRKYGTQ